MSKQVQAYDYGCEWDRVDRQVEVSPAREIDN
jgi:hypothetical protein